jgi:ligand-binding SRPBCC domain-containing protein
MHRDTFVASTRLPASARAVFDWHEAPGAFERLTPPWERVRVLRHEGGIRDGARVSLLVGPWPLSLPLLDDKGPAVWRLPRMAGGWIFKK